LSRKDSDSWVSKSPAYIPTDPRQRPMRYRRAVSHLIFNVCMLPSLSMHSL